MKIVFIGTVQFSLKALEKLIEMDANIAGVCTKSQSNFNADYADLSELCEKHEINYKFVNNINTKENIDWISSLNPDVIYCFGWSSLIKREILNIPRIGVIGFHPAKLPFNRGRHPIIWSLVLGLENTASTFFIMDEGADTGDIISQEDIAILESDDAQSLYSKITAIALKQIQTFTNELIHLGNFKTQIPQKEDEGNDWRKRGKNDGLIHFNMTSDAIYNLVRGLTRPYVGAHIEYKTQEAKVWRVSIAESSQLNIEPGKIIDVDSNSKAITVKTYDGSIILLEHELLELPSVGDYL